MFRYALVSGALACAVEDFPVSEERAFCFFTDLAPDSDFHIALDAELAGEPVGGDQLGVFESGLFLIGHGRNLALQNLDAARGASGDATTAVQDWNPGIFNSEDEFLAFRYVERTVAFNG